MTDSHIIDELRSGCVIPAHPLALQPDNRIDIPRQRALTRYYLSAGAGDRICCPESTELVVVHLVAAHSPCGGGDVQGR